MGKSARVLFALGTLILIGDAARGTPIIWTGPTITFTKLDGADWTLAANQDRLTANVWITRDGSHGIFNIQQESVFANFVSPLGTAWAYGSAANWATLTFQDWEDWTKVNPTDAHGDPPFTLNKPAVLHLISEDIYVDIEFTSWTTGGGGGFSYQRSTPVPEPSTLVVLAAGAVALLAYGWRRRRQAA